MKFNHALLVLLCFALVGCDGGTARNQANNAAAPNASPATDAPAPGVANTEFAHVQASQPPQVIYIIFDASGSMLERLPDKSRKIDVGKKVLKDFVEGDFAGYEVALRVYGHRKRDDCVDSELVVPFGAAGDVVSPIKDYVDKLKALGRTPITLSFQEALKDFGDRSGPAEPPDDPSTPTWV